MQDSKKSILDVFSRIRNEKQASKPDLCVTLWKHLSSTTKTGEVDENGVPMEIGYGLKRLIQGLGSPRNAIRKSYFASLVSLLRNGDFAFGSLSLEYFKELIDAQLSKFESRGEEGEILSGRILAYGAAMRSKIFSSGAVELQQAVIFEMLSKSKERSYLPLLTYTFITEFIKTIDEDTFKTVIWPVIANEIIVAWPSQSFETLYCLLEVQERYPNCVKKKNILSTLGTSSILHEESIENIQKMLMNITWEPRLKHPLYETVTRCLPKHGGDYVLLDKFWLYVEEDLKNSSSRLKSLAAFTIFTMIIEHVQFEKIPDFLTHSLVENICNACRSSVNKTDELSVAGKSTLQLIVTKVTNKEETTNSSAVYKILCKLMFETSQILIDKLTGVKVAFPCISKLDEKHVKLLAKKCENVIFLKSTQKEDENSVSQHWNYKDRCYATQLLARLISHPRSTDMNWKIKHLKLMMRYALFSSKTEDGSLVNGELANTLKKSFCTALSHQLSHLENHRMVLISLVFYIDNILSTGEYDLRTKLSNEFLALWKDTMSKIYKIDNRINKSAKKKTVMHIFHTLFLQMALHLFVDPTVAKNILVELDRCYKKMKAQLSKCDQDDNDSAEPNWIEMTVELFLSLLSHDTYLLRQLISRMFPHLCQHLTAQATFQILQVFDPSSNENILTDDGGDSDGESSSNEEETVEDEQNRSTQGDESEEESDSEIEDIDDVEETAIERTRQAVREALGIAGSVTDTESVDLDDIDEEEGRKLDAALAQAFKDGQKSQSGKNKKQSASDKALTNFRIRVLDLVDIYLDNNPSLSLVLETIPVLFKLLEFTLKDSHQKSLECRIRSTIKKIGQLKKCSNVEEVDVKLLVDSLKSLTDKGVRSTPLFLGMCHEMGECCIFLLRMQIQLSNNEDNDSSSLFYDTVVVSLENFFLKRDCLLSVSLFENILLKTNWIMNLKLCGRILQLSFDPTVRGYRRNQGLSLLNCFYRNTRLLSLIKTINAKKLAALEQKILVNGAKILKPETELNGNLKPTFTSELFSLLYNMKTNKFCVESGEWTKLSDTIRHFLHNGPSASNISRKYVNRLCSALRINPKVKEKETMTTKQNTETEKNCSVAVNGVVRRSDADNSDDSGTECEKKINNDDSVLNSKNIIKKKKSKRKQTTPEHINAKRLRSKIANDVEVLKFSETNLMESS